MPYHPVKASALTRRAFTAGLVVCGASILVGGSTKMTHGPIYMCVSTYEPNKMTVCVVAEIDEEEFGQYGLPASERRVFLTNYLRSTIFIQYRNCVKETNDPLSVRMLSVLTEAYRKEKPAWIKSIRILSVQTMLT